MTLPALEELLDFSPELARAYGNLARQAEWELICATAGKNLLRRESVPRKLEEMREELVGSLPSPLERLLVERVAACWLQLQDVRSCATPAMWEVSR